MEVFRKYNVATTLLFPLIDRGTQDFESTPVSFVAADTQISKDEGVFGNTGSTPAHEGNGIYSLALTATEMQAARISITVIDAATKTWEDQAIIISTYGNASAQHAFDLDTATQTVDLSAAGVDSVWDEDIEAAHGTDATAGFLLRVLGAAISNRTNNATLNALLGVADTAAFTIAETIWDEDIEASHGTDATAGLLLRVLGAAISNRANNPTLDALLGVTDTAAFTIAETLWDEVLAAHTTADTPGQVLNMLTQDTVTLSTDVALGSIFGQLLDDGTGWTYDRTTDSLEILGASIAPTVGAIADAVWDELVAGHNIASTFGEALQSITNGAIADAIWDEVIEAGAAANNQTARQILRIIVAAVAGADAGSGDWSALGIDGLKTRIVATLTAAGKRSAITTLDGST